MTPENDMVLNHQIIYNQQLIILIAHGTNID